LSSRYLINRLECSFPCMLRTFFSDLPLMLWSFIFASRDSAFKLVSRRTIFGETVAFSADMILRLRAVFRLLRSCRGMPTAVTHLPFATRLSPRSRSHGRRGNPRLYDMLGSGNKLSASRRLGGLFCDRRKLGGKLRWSKLDGAMSYWSQRTLSLNVMHAKLPVPRTLRSAKHWGSGSWWSF